MPDIIRFPLNRKIWTEYQHALVDAAKSLNRAQECHRQLFSEENQGLTDAGLRISVEYQRTAQPPQ